MFKNITINLTGPICSCAKQNISFQIWINKSGFPGLILVCKDCTTELVVPHSNFIGKFNLDNPYPADQKIKN